MMCLLPFFSISPPLTHRCSGKSIKIMCDFSFFLDRERQASKAKHKNKKKMKNRLWIIEKQQICGAYQARTTEKNV